MQKGNVWAVLIIVLSFVFLISIILFLIPEREVPYETFESIERKETERSLDIEQKDEICNDILAWMDWCYDNNVAGDVCINQAVDRLPELYDLNNLELKEALEYCKPRIARWE